MAQSMRASSKTIRNMDLESLHYQSSEVRYSLHHTSETGRKICDMAMVEKTYQMATFMKEISFRTQRMVREKCNTM